MEEKEVFVTYSWDSEAHNKNVISLTDKLRQNGFHAEMDVLVSQNETAIDFSKMMHRAMTDYSKVIIVLSPGYKDKADKFKEGVGTEYSLIIKDMNDNPNKYILVSFEGFKNGIYPLAFQSRDTIDLSNQEGYTKLYHKLMDIPMIEFSPVALQKPELFPRKIEATPHTQHTIIPATLEFVGIRDFHHNTHQAGGKYVNIEKSFVIDIKNVGSASTEDFSVDISMPNIFAEMFTKDLPRSRVETDRRIFSFSPAKKIFPSQVFSTDPIKVKVYKHDMDRIENDEIIVTIYSEEGAIKREIPIGELVYEKSPSGVKQPLKGDDFIRW